MVCLATTLLERQVIIVVAFNDVDPVVSLDLFNQRELLKFPHRRAFKFLFSIWPRKPKRRKQKIMVANFYCVLHF